MFDSKHTMYPADGCIHDPPTYEEVPKASQGLSPPYGATSFPSPSTSYHSPVYAPSPLSASPYGQRLSPSPSTSNFRVSPSHSPPRSPQPSSSGSSPTKPGFMSKLTGTDPLDPPPPSFLRAPPQHLPYGPFPPCTIVGRGKNLNKGFPVLLPTSQTEPHPFTTHDVRIDDWTRFLGDVKKAERLSPMNRIVAGLAPAALGLGILPGTLVSLRVQCRFQLMATVAGILLAQGIEHYMKRKKRGLAAQLVDAWNNVRTVVDVVAARRC